MDIKQLRELEAKATAVYDRATRLEYDTSFGKSGDVRVWDKNEAGTCVVVFKGKNAQPTADAYLAFRNAAPYLFAVVEAAEAVHEEGWTNRCECFARGTCVFCIFKAAISNFRNAK